LAKTVQGFFNPLNPYNLPNLDKFKVEHEKLEDGGKGKKLEGVWLYAISAKRYVLYDIDDNGEITIRGYSSHGLGGMTNFRDGREKQLWMDILEMHYHPENEEKVMRKYRGKYAVCRLGITSTDMQRRFLGMNVGKSYYEQIKPYNFVTVGIGRHRKPGKGPQGQLIIPLLPYISDKSPNYRLIPYLPFTDYRTGEKYSNDSVGDGRLWTKSYWKPLARVVKEYMNHAESKSEGVTEDAVGELKRRHVHINDSSIR
jgi:hypothetical protein